MQIKLPLRSRSRSLPFSLVLSLFAGCVSGAARPEAASPPAAAVNATPPAAAPASLANPHGRAVADLVGVWAGDAIGTPRGDFPFAIAFDREAGGDVHGRIDDGRGMYLDFRFHRDGARWLLVEEGEIPGAGRQARTLVPAAGGNAPRWIAERSPGSGAQPRGIAEPAHVTVELAIDAGALVMTTTVGGERHAVFRLQRARGEAAAR